jgi:DNA-binding Lrp family transcriptional regulator
MPNSEPTDLPDIDAIDRRILSELQEDGRMTNVELAKRAGISAPPCLRRVRRLEEAGVIRAFERMVAAWPEVRECHMIRGGGDFLLRLVARNTAQENDLTRRLTEAANVARIQTLQTIRTSRSLAGVPI